MKRHIISMIRDFFIALLAYTFFSHVNRSLAGNLFFIFLLVRFTLMFVDIARSQRSAQVASYEAYPEFSVPEGLNDMQIRESLQRYSEDKAAYEAQFGPGAVPARPRNQTDWAQAAQGAVSIGSIIGRFTNYRH